MANAISVKFAAEHKGYAGADKLTLYASPYLVASSGQYTKQNTGSYYRQYFGWFDKNGDRILIINAYHIKEIDTDKKKEYFKTYYFSISAMCPFCWYVEINFDKKKCLNFEYGG